MLIKQESLQKALRAASLRELPSPADEKHGYWTKAVVLVAKRNQTESYALAERNAKGVISIRQDFGMMSAITGIKNIYPYIYLDEKRVINTSSNVAKQAISEHFSIPLDYVEGMAEDQLTTLAEQMAIDTQNENAALESLIADQIEESIEIAHQQARLDNNDPNVMVGDMGIEEIEDIQPEIQPETKKRGRKPKNQ